MKYDAREVRAIYDRGENVMQWLKSREGRIDNSPTAILYSYDAQAGSYTEKLSDEYYFKMQEGLGRRIAGVLGASEIESVLEAGIGEATSLVPVLTSLGARPPHISGFDLSLSRLLFAREHLKRHGYEDMELFVASLDRIPLADAAVDVVLTFHAVEPNRGLEKKILGELLRIARRKLIMLEPSYELSNSTARARMERLGYVRCLPEALHELGCRDFTMEPWGSDGNPENPAMLMVVNIENDERRSDREFRSPISGARLVVRSDCLYCPEDGHAFPVISGVPCLTIENAVLVSKLGDFA